jgi:uroporphyrinogen decarboxylase
MTDAVGEYLVLQTLAGADIVQIFDTWAGIMTKDAFLEFSLPYMMQIIDHVKANSDVPVILFAKGANSTLPELAVSGADVLGLDWTMDIGEVRAAVGHHVALQGNLDPVALYSSPESIRAEVRRILEYFGNNPGHIFNLGHGILPTVPPSHAKAMIDAVKEISVEIRAEAQD